MYCYGRKIISSTVIGNFILHSNIQFEPLIFKAELTYLDRYHLLSFPWKNNNNKKTRVWNGT